MIKVNKTAICADIECNNEFTKFRTTDKFCSYECKKKNTVTRPKKGYTIPKVSAKQKAKLAEYYKVRADFMNNLKSQVCPVFPDKCVTDVHHKKGREGFADAWAKENNIPLLIDTRYFLAVSRAGHQKIENQPEWAKENNFSEDRLTIINN
jgi:hypothetical protein